MTDDQDEDRKKVDSEWKRRAREEKSRIAGAQAESLEGGTQAEAERESPSVPEPSFLVFVSTLASQALLALGEIEHPSTGNVQVDLPQAKYTIDLLQLLKDKSKGNLTADEADALDAYLYDLRMKYVRQSSI